MQRLNTTELLVRSDGTIETIGDPPAGISELGDTTRTRVSNILPVYATKRAVFLALRWTFGETGLVAKWTRTWEGPWACTLFETGEQVVRTHRSDCVAWEHERLSELMSNEKP
jgi:hypothetical protein